MNALAYRSQASRPTTRAGTTHAARAQTDHGPAAPGANGRPLRAVIVDDSPSLLRVLSSLLGQESNVQLVGCATDGYAAVRRVTELKPDLVLMDLHLPGINGLEATRQIKARFPAPTVILVTADDTPGCRKAALAAGTNAFVDKQRLSTRLRPAFRKLFPKPDR
ncbi:MAG TPA: response regulator transcription factor [Candidatus Acidoferrum sp.]|nr:response regulator transcription factor [Candidatus Acidoferrum sp.]